MVGGPLLYDVAMEWATINGGGLMPDRDGMPTPEAQAVWKFYLYNRSDVTPIQLDDLQNTLTPQDDTDNCQQHDGIRGSWYDLEDSPLSKRYVKEPTTIRALEEGDRLIVIV